MTLPFSTIGMLKFKDERVHYRNSEAKELIFRLFTHFLLQPPWGQYEPGHNISNKSAHVPSVDSDQSAHSFSLISVLAEHSVDTQWSKASSGGQRRLWSDCAKAQADLSLRWAHMQSCNKYCAPAPAPVWYWPKQLYVWQVFIKSSTV